MPQNSKGARLWLYKRKGRKSLWLIRDGGFQRSTGYGVDEREKAEEALADYITSRRPDTSRRYTHEIGVAEVLNLYQMDIPINKPSRELTGYLVANLLQYWGGKSLAEVKGSTCRAYLEYRTHGSKLKNSPTSLISPDSRTHKSVTPSTVRRELKVLSAAINHWHRESPLVAVPKVSLPEEGERRERVLERSEVARMLWACRKRKYGYVARFILIGIYTGTRKRALLSLRWSSALTGGHVDLERGIIFRRGSAERETSKRRPPVQISRRLRGHLVRWAAIDAEKFPQVVHFSGAGIHSLKRAWATIRKDAGLGPEVTPHVLRHTCCSWLLWEGKTIWDVAGIVGADATTIERVYGHHLIKQERKKA
jgi:integrase